MKLSTRSRLLTTTMVPFVIGLGLATAACTDGTAKTGGYSAAACKACGACSPCGGCNPCAAAGCNPCNPCGGCNPCGACGACGACAPCGPCGACGACGPCGAGGSAGMTECVVPRIACNPCAAAACNPCNPCGACNPCAAAACNPCNPCGACNPCAAAACNPCNPCGACNPCAAAGCNPCNPCGACGPCGACSPCGAGGDVELTDAEARDAYACAKSDMVAAYSKSGVPAAAQYVTWTNYATSPYISATHGGRFVNNHANFTGAAYGNYEDAGTLPAGTVLAKDSFAVDGKGRVKVGPLFLMAKMAAGFSAETGDWQYTMIMPNGSVYGTTNAAGSAKVRFCADCHNAMADNDALWLLPEEYRR